MGKAINPGSRDGKTTAGRIRFAIAEWFRNAWYRRPKITTVERYRGLYTEGYSVGYNRALDRRKAPAEVSIERRHAERVTPTGRVLVVVGQ